MSDMDKKWKYLAALATLPLDVLPRYVLRGLLLGLLVEDEAKFFASMYDDTSESDNFLREMFLIERDVLLMGFTSYSERREKGE